MKKLIELDNKLRIVYVQNTTVRSVAVGVFVGVGSIFENEEINGASHFIEHMSFKGTKTRSSFDIANEIDCIGAQINAYTSKCNTCYYTLSLDKNVEKCIDILSDMYFNASFDKEELERERKVILEEINESLDTPEDVCYDNLQKILFEGNSLCRPILGTKETVGSITREQLLEYKNKHYTAENTVISIAGNISEEEVLRLVNKYFKFDNNSSDNEHNVEKAIITPGHIYEDKDIEQVHIAMAFPCYKYGSKDLNYVQLLASIFGLNMSSRLFQAIREKLGLCYSICAYPASSYKNGAFYILTSTNKNSVKKAIFAIKEQIDLLLKDGITDEELNKAKEQVNTDFVLKEESTSGMMRSFGNYAVMMNELYNCDEVLKIVDEATKDDILRVSKEIFDFSKMNISIVGKNVDFDFNSLK